MKHNKNHDNGPDKTIALLPVHFEFADSSAHSVCIAGTFNNWEPEAKPMHSLEGGRWVKDTELPAGEYEYCLVVDGQFRTDPRSLESVPNPFGGHNSVLIVSSSKEAAHCQEAAHLPLAGI